MKHSRWKGGEPAARPSKQPSLPGAGVEPQFSSPSLTDPEVGALERYLHEIRGTSLLSADGERELAEEIEQRELAHWQAILARPDALAPLRKALEPAQVAELDAHAQRTGGVKAGADRPRESGAAALETARRLRALDPTREALKRADAAVRSAYADVPSAHAYLAAVARAHAAQRASKARFAKANLRLVLAMARRYEKRRVALADLVQEGNIGLLIAVERFDHRLGFRFSTYAAWWIRHCLNRAVAKDARLIRIPVHAQAAALLVRRANDASAMKTGHELSDEELAQHTGMPLDKLAFVKAHAAPSSPISLDQAIGKDRDQTWHDVIAGPEQPAPEESISLTEWHGQLEQLMKHLTPMEASILEYRFGLDDEQELSLQAIGEKYDLTRERIRQIQNQALEKVRRELQKLRADRKGPNPARRTASSLEPA